MTTTTTKNAFSVFFALDGDQQENALRRAAWKARKRDQAQECKRKWTWTDDLRAAELEDAITGIVNEGWTRIAEWNAAEMYTELDADAIGLLLDRAVNAAAQFIGRMERRNARALRQREDENGNTSDYIIDHAAPMAEYAPGPEESVILRDLLDRLPADDIDKAILRGLQAGEKKKDIAASLGISPAAITKRINRMKDRADND